MPAIIRGFDDGPAKDNSSAKEKCDDTMLEIDLAEVESAPESFRSR
jgi:hypothetical protein